MGLADGDGALGQRRAIPNAAMQIGRRPRGNAHLRNKNGMLRYRTVRNSPRPNDQKTEVVQKIITPRVPHEPEMAEIAIEGADHLYREIRIENALEDEKGKPVKLKAGAQVEVTVEADPKETAPAV
jgi:hypothetical protein